MELTLDNGNALYRIQSYKNGCITVNGQTYKHPIVVSPNALIAPWGPDSFEEITAIHFKCLLAFDPQVVLFGTGEQLRFCPPVIFTALIERNIGFEVMNTAAACRTYTVLMAEERRVVCALLC